DWNQPAGDFHRPLLHQGRLDAANVARKLKSSLPDSYIIWSSAAERAMQTAFIVAGEVGYPEENIIIRQDLYTFDCKALERTIRQCDNIYNCLVVFGHNEAITDFVNKFGDIFIDNVPTAGCVTINFGTNDWDAIGIGTTENVILPKDLRS
ncbi:MAG: histidine phosphatase family protein, partial [Flavobacterium sp.]